MQRFVRLVWRKIKKAGRYVRHHKKLTFLWLLGAFFFLIGFGLLWAASLPLPDLSSLSQIRVDQSIKIYDRTGQVLLYSLSNNDIQRTVVPLSEVSPNIQDAIIAVEARHFIKTTASTLKAFCAPRLSTSPTWVRRRRLNSHPAGY